MITITKQPQQQYENAYNNQVFEWTGDPGKTAVRSNVTVRLNPDDPSSEYALTSFDFVNVDVPSNLNKFYFNAKSSVTSLFNRNNFADGILPESGFRKIDPKLISRITFDISVEYNDGTAETESVNKYYFKSVRNLFDGKRNLVYNGFILLNETDYFNYYEGLPFEFSFYNPQTKNCIVRNEANGLSTTFDIFRGVNRFWLSNGLSDNNNFESLVPLITQRVNTLTFVDSTTSETYLTIRIYKHKECKAPYMKWFNSMGSWSYFRFEPIYQGNINPNNREILNDDFDNFNDSPGSFKSTGVTGSRDFNLFTGSLNQDEVENIRSLFLSPRKFLYDQDLNRPIQANDFKEVRADNSSKQDINTKLLNRGFNLQFEIPKLNTQSYAN